MTGLQPTIGSGDTRDWVSDGLLFTLVDSGGGELARATARVKCSPFPDPIAAALASTSYFPLQVGNEWVYRIDSRLGPPITSPTASLVFALLTIKPGSPSSPATIRRRRLERFTGPTRRAEFINWT